MSRVERLPRSCPLGVCDGSGWIEDSDDTARGLRLPRAPRRPGPHAWASGPCCRPSTRASASIARRSPTWRATRRARGVVEAVRAYVDELDGKLAEGRGLWLEGDVGTGKTTLAMLVSKRAIEAGHSVAIYSLPRLLARIRRTYDGDAGELSYLEFFDA